MRAPSALTHDPSSGGGVPDGPSRRGQLPHELANLVPAAVYTARTGVDGAWLYASSQVEQIVGYTAEEFIADAGLWARILHMDDRGWVLAAEEQNAHVVDVTRFCTEYRVIARDGRVVWVVDDVTVLADGDGGSIQHGLLFDITHRKVAELLLAEQADVLGRIARGATLRETLQALAGSLVRVTGAETCAITLAATGTTYAAGPDQALGAGQFDRLPFRGLDGGVLGELVLLRSAGGVRQSLGWARRLAALAVDRSRQVKAEERSYSLLAATLESTADGILVIDDGGAVVSSNQRFRDMWRIPDSVMDAGSDDALIDFVAEQLADGEAFVAELHRLRTQLHLSSVDEIAFRDGRTFERESQPQLLEGRPVGRVWSFRDVTAFRQMEADLRDQAYTDSLTCLPNRRRFTMRLAELAPDEGPVATGVALLLIDVDDFNTVNDGLGHLAGDAVLTVLAERIARGLPDGDMASRVGGDAFALLLACPDGMQDACRAAQRVLDDLAAPLDVDGRQLSVRASVGIALSDGATPARHLFRNADLAMHTAKRSGGARLQLYAAAMHDVALTRLDLKSDLDRAINDDALGVAYQPVVSLESGLIVGFEALARWDHPQLGAISPAEFVPLAEETGLIGRLGRWVLARACADLGGWHQALGTTETKVSVNLSPRELDDPDLADQVAAVIADSGLPPASICLEITESALGASDGDVSVALADLRARGIRLSLDDFGTGYSSLARLGSYPFDVIKIDRSFVIGLDEGTRDQAIILAVLRLAEAFGLEVVAEGVETATQRDVLAAMGCQRVQGFLYSRAVPADEALALLTSGVPLG